MFLSRKVVTLNDRIITKMITMITTNIYNSNSNTNIKMIMIIINHSYNWYIHGEEYVNIIFPP